MDLPELAGLSVTPCKVEEQNTPRVCWPDVPYVYKPLLYSDSIRLIKLVPRESGLSDQLACELLDVRLSETPDFEAISYAWEAAVFPDTLHISKNFSKSPAASPLRYESFKTTTNLDFSGPTPSVSTRAMSPREALKSPLCIRSMAMRSKSWFGSAQAMSGQGMFSVFWNALAPRVSTTGSTHSTLRIDCLG